MVCWVTGCLAQHRVRATGSMGTRNGPAGLVIILLRAALRIGTQLSVPCLVQTSASPEKDSHRTTATLKMKKNPATLGPCSLHLSPASGNQGNQGCFPSLRFCLFKHVV